MCRLIALLLLATALAVLLALSWVARQWGVQGLLAVLAIGLVLTMLMASLARLAMPWLIKRLLISPWRFKGRVLHKARVEIHALRPALMPVRVRGVEDQSDPAHESGASTGGPGLDLQRDWYELDLTITPKPSAGRFIPWDPRQLRVVPLGTPKTAPSADQDHPCVVWGMRVLQEYPTHGTSEQGLYAGPLRLLLTLGLRHGQTPPLTLRYYMEDLGRLDLPRHA